MKSTLSLFLLIILTGCSSYKENFDCPVSTGMGCTSLSRVNKAIDKGRFQEEPDYDDNHETSSKEIVNIPRGVWGDSFTSVR